MMSALHFPEHLKYTADHEWLDQEGTEAYIGITAFAARELGDIVFLDLLLKGRTLLKGEVFGTVEAVKTVSDLLMPVSGTILEINQRVEQAPELVNGEPYGEGWLIRIKLQRVEELKLLLDAETYQNRL